MANKYVALLLVVCLVAVEAEPTLQSGETVVTPEECFEYCVTASLYPRFASEPVCRFRCQFPMYNSVTNGVEHSARRYGPVAAPVVSPVPVPKTH